MRGKHFPGSRAHAVLRGAGIVREDDRSVFGFPAGLNRGRLQGRDARRHVIQWGTPV